MRWLYRLAGRLREFGPYLAMELIVPGGSMLALLLRWYRRNHNNTADRLAELP